jgi:thiamine biosynthesis protein ThiS
VIHVNNREKIEWRDGMTVSDLLDSLNYTYHQIIVQVNGELVPRDSYGTYLVPDGADVKAIHLIAGG